MSLEEFAHTRRQTPRAMTVNEAQRRFAGQKRVVDRLLHDGQGFVDTQSDEHDLRRGDDS